MIHRVMLRGLLLSLTTLLSGCIVINIQIPRPAPEAPRKGFRAREFRQWLHS